jgi:hypothetical protein
VKKEINKTSYDVLDFSEKLFLLKFIEQMQSLDRNGGKFHLDFHLNVTT